MTNFNKLINDTDFAILADNLPDFVGRYDLDGRIIYLNKKLTIAIGVEMEKALGRLSSELFPDGRFDEYENKILKCAKTTIEDYLNMSVPEINGRLEHHHIRIVPEKNSQGKTVGVIAFGRDMTERFYLEQSLTMSSRMASLGEMAGGIAHEINNPLAIIKGKCYNLMQLNKRGKLDEENVLKLASEIDRTVDRIEKVVKGLRNFSRDATSDPLKSEFVQTIIFDSLAICEKAIINSGIEIVHDFQNIAPVSVNCRSSEISQILINLLSNAKDALKDTEKPCIRIGIQIDEHKVYVTVEDNGPGIPKELRAKIMQPFFTTKPAGSGTGLGLSISKSIALAHGGDLVLDPSVQKTKFVLSLPNNKTTDI